jgi:Cupin-like domain
MVRMFKKKLQHPRSPLQRMNSLVVFALAAVTVTAWEWIPEDEHPCSITRFSWEEFLQTFGPRGLPALYPEPVVVVRDHETNKEFRSLTQQEALLNFFPPNFTVTLSSSNAFSEHRRTIPLQQYLNESWTSFETTPDQLSNETWYLFGETYTDEWKELLQLYEMPPCHTCVTELVALSFGIGNRGSGVQWHVHGPGFSEALHGRKHWVLYPPGTVIANYHKDQSSRQWMEFEYPLADKAPLECTLNPGDAIYFPDKWWHATINLDPYTAFVSTFTTEHNIAVSDYLYNNEL